MTVGNSAGAHRHWMNVGMGDTACGTCANRSLAFWMVASRRRRLWCFLLSCDDVCVVRVGLLSARARVSWGVRRARLECANMPLRTGERRAVLRAGGGRPRS